MVFNKPSIIYNIRCIILAWVVELVVVSNYSLRIFVIVY